MKTKHIIIGLLAAIVYWTATTFSFSIGLDWQGEPVLTILEKDKFGYQYSIVGEGKYRYAVKHGYQIPQEVVGVVITL